MYHDTYVWMGTVNPLWVFLMGLGFLFISFIPSFIAVSRNHPNRVAIVILNILFGWTGLGWIILLIWSLTRPATLLTR